MQKNHVSTKLFIVIAWIMVVGIFSSTFSNPDSNGLDSEPNNKVNLLWQESNNSNTNTVNAKQIYFSHGNITDQTIIESGINGTKAQVSYEDIGQFTDGDPRLLNTGFI